MPDNNIQSDGFPSISLDETKEKLEEKIHEIRQKELEEELKVKAEDLGLGYVNLKGVPITENTLRLISKKEAERLKIICFYFKEFKEIRLALVDPNISGLEEVKNKLKAEHGAQVNLYLTSEESFSSALKQYEHLPKIHGVTKGIEIKEENLIRFSSEIKTLQDLQEKIYKISVTEVLSLVIAAAIKIEATDIHLEAEEEDIKVRFRIDGVLHLAAILDKNEWPKIISRIKLLSSLKINIEDKPQDGRFNIFLKGDKIDVRVSVLPTAYGESVVMRLLRAKTLGFKFEDLGLKGSTFQKLEKEIKKPNGLIITCGPTGVGKTTTLYAILNKLNKEGIKILTIEDPIEYELSGINQSQVDPAKGYTFAKGLKTLVRQDPDVIMVGEMRDLETVEIVLNAALTGHLALSTLHTNDAAGALPRFLAMGAKPYLLTPALNCVLAQRLVRKICPHCKKEIKLKREEEERVKKLLETLPSEIKKSIKMDKLVFYKGTGCKACDNIGFRGRTGIFEIFAMTKEIEKIILSGEISEYKIREIIIKNGMVTMTLDGVLKALEGITSLDEVFRVAE